jgi:hypothetical protein
MQKLADSPASTSSALNGFECHRARLKQFRRQAIHSIGRNTQQEQQQRLITQDTPSLTHPTPAKPTLIMVNRKTSTHQPTLNSDPPIHLQVSHTLSHSTINMS